MRRALRRFAQAALALLLLAAAVTAVFFSHPELLLTSRTAGAAIERLGASYAPRWSSLSFSASAAGRWRHRYVLIARDVCADHPDGLFAACFARLELDAVVSFSRRGPRLERLEYLTADGGDVAVDLRRKRGPSSAPRRPPAALMGASVGSIAVRVPALVVRTAGFETKGRFSAELTPGRPRPLAVEAWLVSRGAGRPRRVKAALSADMDLFKGGTLTFVDARGRGEVQGLAAARAHIRARRDGAGFRFTGEFEADASTGPVKRVRLTSCRGSAARTAGEFSCRYEAVAARTFAGSVRGRGATHGQRFSASVKADADPVAAWYDLSGGAQAKLAGRFGRPLETLSYEAHAGLKGRFEDLVASLRGTKHAIPAPIHALKGPFTLALESRGDPRAESLRAAYVLTTQLAGARQRLIARAEGKVSVSRPRGPDRRFEHEGDILLKDAAFDIPRLEVGAAPKVTVDRRIRTGVEEPVASPSAPAKGRSPRPLPLRSRATVRTERPLLLYSNLAKEPVPAALDLVVHYPPAAAGGTVEVRKFDIELFRRNATVDHFNVLLTSGSTVGALDGLVLYRTPMALVSIHVQGTTERPRIELTSEPPLKREDIIGLLIFGKNPEELDPDQTASVSNTETALESRAFGLVSLYLFGATPIEQVRYDPSTKTASVKLRLPGGTNLTLGSDFDQSRQLSVRKALAPHWAIQSEITEQGQQSRAAATFLEWFNRY